MYSILQITDVFTIDSAALTNMKLSVTSSKSNVRQTQRHEEATQREIQKNLKRTALTKIRRMAQLCNLDVYHPHTLLALVLVYMKTQHREELLRKFFQAVTHKKSEEDTSVPDNTGKIIDLETLFHFDILTHWEDSYCDCLNTVLDWCIIMEYIDVSGDRKVNESLDKKQNIQDLQVVQAFAGALEHGQIENICAPEVGFIHVMIDRMPSVKLLERLILREEANMDHTGVIHNLEVRCLRALSAFNDIAIDPAIVSHNLLEIFRNAHVRQAFFEDMVTHDEQLVLEKAPTPHSMPRLQLRHSMERSRTNETHNVSHSFQTWAAQQRFSVVSGRHMQLVLYFIRVQTKTPERDLYSAHYTDSVVERTSSAPPVQYIDPEALFELISGVRTYYQNLRTLIDFRMKVLGMMSRKMQSEISLVQALQLYIIAFQHPSVMTGLWKRVAPMMNHSVRHALEKFCRENDFEIGPVLHNLVHANKEVAMQRLRT